MYNPCTHLHDDHISSGGNLTSSLFLCTHTTRRHRIGGKITLFNKMAGNKIVGFIQARMNLHCRRSANMCTYKTLLFANLEAAAAANRYTGPVVCRVYRRRFSEFIHPRAEQKVLCPLVFIYGRMGLCVQREHARTKIVCCARLRAEERQKNWTNIVSKHLFMIFIRTCHRN